MQTKKPQIRACVRVRSLPPTDRQGSRYAVQDQRPAGDSAPWRIVLPKDSNSETPEADAAQVWLDRYINKDVRRRAAILCPVAMRWGRDVFFTWTWEDRPAL